MIQKNQLGPGVLALVLIAYLCAMLATVIYATHSRIEPAPVVRLDTPILPTQAPDFRAISDIPQRKQAFFDFMRPLVAHHNAFYQQERTRLQAISAKLIAERPLSRTDKRKIAYWSKLLHLPEDMELSSRMEHLQRRLHTIPEAMVLAQAAAESGWGQSRFAREAHNYFGQWCYTPGCGLVPAQRAAGAKHEVRRFDSAQDAVAAYFLNINTHRAYRSLRDLRLATEQAGESFTGDQLVGQLGSYSERGQDYIRELRAIIRGNALE